MLAFALVASPAAADELPVPTQPEDEVRDTIREVLRRPEFQPPRKSAVQRAREWVLDRLGRALGELFDGDRGTILAWAILAVILAVVGFFAVRFGRGVTPDPARQVALDMTPRRSATDWRAEAHAQEVSGEWRLGLRSRYRALVADLATRGLVDEVPGRTTGEYRGAVASNVPRAAGDFAGATELFERAWYGNRATGPDEAERFRELDQRVLEGAKT